MKKITRIGRFSPSERKHARFMAKKLGQPNLAQLAKMLEDVTEEELEVMIIYFGELAQTGDLCLGRLFEAFLANAPPAE